MTTTSMTKLYHGTVHSSKGKEWTYVFVLDVDDLTYTDFNNNNTTTTSNTNTTSNNNSFNANTSSNSNNVNSNSNNITTNINTSNNHTSSTSSSVLLQTIPPVVQDSKNLLYVAISRAKEFLFLLFQGRY